VAVALADKLDMLVGFWAIDEKPTGSKDPFALRRAALGFIRIVLEREKRVNLAQAIALAQNPYREALTVQKSDGDASQILKHRGEVLLESLRDFFADRLKVYLRDNGARHDLIDAVFALQGQDDLLMIVQRVEALGRFLETEDGASLLTLIRRALNILKIEEKKDARTYEGKLAAKLLKLKEEKALDTAIKGVRKDVDAALETENFESAMKSLAKLRQPVDAFFDKVTVNAEEALVRENRLTLLAGIRALTLQIADFSKIEG